MTPQSIISDLRSTGGDPELFATQLIQSSASAVNDADPACADKTGYEHCTDCAMPAINTLVDELVKVKDTVWTAQQTMATNANTVCDKDTPADREGGAAKCCSASGTTSTYDPAGFNGCTAGSTFSPSDTAVPLAADVKYNNVKGYYYDAGTPSSMIDDCCSRTSDCHTNDAMLAAALTQSETLLNTLHSDRAAKQQKIDSVSIEVSMEGTKITQHRADIRKVCTLATDATHDADANLGVFGVDPIDTWPTTLTSAKAICTGGQIKRIVDAEVSRQTKLDGDAVSFGQTIAVIEKVVVWLETDGGTSIFQNNEHTDAPTVPGAITTAPAATAAPSNTTPTAMVSLLESTAKSTTNTEAKQALAKAAQLVQGSASDVRGAAAVISLLKQILGDMESSKAKILTYKTTSQAEADGQVTNLVSLIANSKAKRDSAMKHKAQLEGSVAGYTQDVTTKTGEIATEQQSWVLKYQQRELNSQKCIAFMVMLPSPSLSLCTH
jgi:hypothetical protein